MSSPIITVRSTCSRCRGRPLRTHQRQLVLSGSGGRYTPELAIRLGSADGVLTSSPQSRARGYNGHYRYCWRATTWSATLPGDHIELDVDDPRTVRKVIASGTPSIVDLDAELAKLTMFRGRTPQSTMAERKGSAARLASYRDGGLSITKFAGKGHWEADLAGDELIHVLDGAATLEILGDDGPQSFALRAGM
jgi:hypothetical protein